MNRSALRLLAWPAASAMAGAALFAAYLAQSTRDTYVNSDGASNALQAWDMLHGNVLLHGWALADVSFYTTDMPQYMLVEAVRGLGPDAVHTCAALTYTVLVLLAGWLAKGRASGAEGVTRFLIAAGIMLAPQLGSPTGILLLSPDHVATAVPLLLCLLIIDRGETAPPTPLGTPLAPGGQPPGDPPIQRAAVAVGGLLAWAAVGDPLAWIIGALPLAVVCGMRVFQGNNRSLRSLLAAAVASVPVAWLATRLIGWLGGWTVTPFQSGLASSGVLGRNAGLTAEGILQLFGADFLHQPQQHLIVFAYAHLIGVALVVWGFWLAVRRFFGADLVVQVLAVAIAVNLPAYLFTVQAQDITRTREIAAVLPFGAVLAGRQLAGRLINGRLRAARLVSAMTVLLAGYGGMLAWDIVQPPAQAPYSDLAGWLAAHGLRSGLAGYWQASSVTLDSRDTVQVRPASITGGKLASESWWDSRKTWYDPATHYADFVVSVSSARRWQDQTMIRAAEAIAGPPVRVYQFRAFTVAVWPRNLLASLRPD